MGPVIATSEAGRALLQRRGDDSNWDLIGGFMEPGETFGQTLRREALEVICVEIGFVEVLEAYSGPDFFHTYPHGAPEATSAHHLSLHRVCVATVRQRSRRGAHHPCEWRRRTACGRLAPTGTRRLARWWYSRRGAGDPSNPTPRRRLTETRSNSRQVAATRCA